MRKNWLKDIQKDETLLDDFLDEYRDHLDDAKKDVEIGNNITQEAKRLPHVVDVRFSQLQDIEAIYEYFDIQLKKLRSTLYKHYLTNYQQKLTSRDVDRYIEGEPQYVDMMIKLNNINLLRNKFASITKGLEYKHFQLTNIAKLKAAGVDDLI